MTEPQAGFCDIADSAHGHVFDKKVSVGCMCSKTVTYMVNEWTRTYNIYGAMHVPQILLQSSVVKVEGTPSHPIIAERL